MKYTKHIMKYRYNNEDFTMDIVPVRQFGKKSIIGLKIVQGRFREETIKGVPYVFSYGADYECGHEFFNKAIRSVKKLDAIADKMLEQNKSFIDSWRKYLVNN